MKSWWALPFFVWCDSEIRSSEFRRTLAALSTRFVEGAKHTKVYLNGKQMTLPRHGNQEIGEGPRLAILRQLGVKSKDR